MEDKIIIYQYPRGWSFNLYHNGTSEMYKSFSNLNENIEIVPLYSYVIINNIYNVQEHGNMYQKQIDDYGNTFFELKGNLASTVKTFDDIMLDNGETLNDYISDIYERLARI